MREFYTLYIADDHQIVIDGLKLLLENETGLKIIGSAQDGQVALDQIKSLKPDIALIDLRMPNKNGIQIIRELVSQVPTLFIVLTMQLDKRIVTDARNYGAKGFLLKNSGREELIKCIRNVIGGEVFFPKFDKPAVKSVLSPREIDILKLVLEGFTSLQISEQLHLSVLTVETHRKNIYRKTQINTVPGLLKFARENELLD